jgi:hypothetical protein
MERRLESYDHQFLTILAKGFRKLEEKRAEQERQAKEQKVVCERSEPRSNFLEV